MIFYCFENTDKTNWFDSDWCTRQKQYKNRNIIIITSKESRRKRGKQYLNVKKFGNPFIVLGSRLSRPTEAKVWSPDWQVGDTVFVLGVLTTVIITYETMPTLRPSGRGGHQL